MRHQTLGFFSILLFISLLGCQSGPTEADRAAILDLTAEAKRAWDAFDPDATAALYLEDADLTFPTGPWVRGREAIRSTFDWDPIEGRTIEFDIVDLRFLTGEVALANVEAHISGGKDSDGNPLPDYWDAATWVFQRKNNEWKMAALRVMPARADYEEVKAAIRKSLDDFIAAWTGGDASAAASFFTADALNFRPGEEVDEGRGAVEEMFRSALTSGQVQECEFETLELTVFGETAFERGRFRQVWKRTARRTEEENFRYFSVWKRQPDGRWLMDRFLFNEAP